MAKVNLHAVPELKNTTDDAIAPYLKSLGYTQSHTLTDVRLFLGFSGCVIAGCTFYYDYTLGWDKTKHLTLYAVVAYFILNSLLTWWIWWVESGTVYVGTKKDGVKITVASRTEKYAPTYELKVVTTDKSGKIKKGEAKGTYAAWFDQNGYLVKKPFHTFVGSALPDGTQRAVKK